MMEQPSTQCGGSILSSTVHRASLLVQYVWRERRGPAKAPSSPSKTRRKEGKNRVSHVMSFTNTTGTTVDLHIHHTPPDGSTLRVSAEYYSSSPGSVYKHPVLRHHVTW
jgi:hypothetical protein